ncbi:MAG TPA: M13 family metallopeptidase, partial [Steroidobacteraceae bacterium]|nr:M13 family metallopeptidase [Steroidobacteraceae bacterium]
ETPYAQLPYSPVLDTVSMDRSVDPCEDLYAYACGNWQVSNPIPADQASWSVYSRMYHDNQRYLWGILQDAAAPRVNRTPAQQKIGDYFSACMDVDAVEKAGIAPLRADLAAIDALSDRRQLGALLGELQARIATPGLLLNADAEQDARDANRVIAGVDAGGLGLPDRDYYLLQDAKSREIREHYQAHIATMLGLLAHRGGDADGRTPEAQAAVIQGLETRLAQATLSATDRRDPQKLYHRSTLAQLAAAAPHFDWAGYFAGQGMDTAPWLNVSEPAFVQAVDALVATTPLPDLEAYLRWHLLDAAAEYLPREFAHEHFLFQRGYLLGVKAETPRWRTCVQWVDRDLGDDLGREFVARAFPALAQKKAVRMTAQIEAAMKARIGRLTWMSQATRRRALTKLAAIRNKIGYPQVWRDYSALIIQRGDLYGDVARAASFESHRQAAKIGRPVDRDEWFMTAPTVNAYYNPQMNDLNFPAGVLMPPVFDAKSDDAPNYGDTGGTIGHELTHAFDDEGRQYDGNGNLKDWWSEADARGFEQRAKCLVDQYSGYTAIDDMKVNGQLTLGENIADLGGEILGWMAWQEQVRGMHLAPQDGLTPEQRFFVGFAQWACANERPERVRASTINDPHSPPKYRINGVAVNMPEFAHAFHCRAGQAMVRKPEDVCKIW